MAVGCLHFGRNMSELGEEVALHAKAWRASCDMKCGIWTWTGPCFSIGIE